MAAWWSNVAGVMPWWAWVIASGIAAIGFTLSWASALAVISAAGANHGSLTHRQRRMARYASMASLAAIPLTAGVGLFALLTAAWALFT
jgi:2-methylisocitrate lyase-like PEP mutase family enzyme